MVAHLEELGFYNPRTDEVRLDIPGLVKRLQEGAQPTDTVRRILAKANVFEQVSVHSKSIKLQGNPKQLKNQTTLQLVRFLVTTISRGSRLFKPRL